MVAGAPCGNELASPLGQDELDRLVECQRAAFGDGGLELVCGQGEQSLPVAVALAGLEDGLPRLLERLRGGPEAAGTRDVSGAGSQRGQQPEQVDQVEGAAHFVRERERLARQLVCARKLP